MQKSTINFYSIILIVVEQGKKPEKLETINSVGMDGKAEARKNSECSQNISVYLLKRSNFNSISTQRESVCERERKRKKKKEKNAILIIMASYFRFKSFLFYYVQSELSLFCVYYFFRICFTSRLFHL